MAREETLDDWQLLAQVSHIFRGVSDSFTDQVDMHRGQAMLLCTVAGKDGMTQTEIAEELSIQGATVTNMLQKMEETGLVARRRDHGDNRLVRVYITDVGREKERVLQEQFLSMQALVFKEIPDADRAKLRQILNQVIKNLSGVR